MAARLKRLAQYIGWGRLFGLSLLVALLAVRVADPVPLQLLRLKVFDIYQNISPRIPDKRPVVIVDIDEASLEHHGQWPWPRTLIARLVDRLTASGAAAIGFDIVFPEPDRTSPDLLASSLTGLSDTARAEIARARNHDEIFAEALARSRVVLGQSAYNPKKGQRRTSGAPKASFATMGGDPKRFLIKYPDLLANIPILEQAAKGRGMFTVLPDPDGIIRRVPVVLVANGELIPSLSADLLRVATGQTTYLIKTAPTGIQSVVIAGVQLPTDQTGQLWLHFSPHRDDRFVSAKDVLAGAIPAERFTRRLVLIGTSASGLLDQRATPVDPVMPGVEVHAQLLESILSGQLLRRPDYAIGAEVLLALVVGLAIVILAPILGARTVFVLGSGIAALVIGGCWYLFSEKRLLLDAAYPMISSFAVFVTMLSVNYFREESRRRQIRGAFGQYLSPDLVKQLADDPDRLVLGGETREMTILFSDVRGFTSISESYKEDPQGLTVLINRLLTPFSNAIMETGGTIDKYMGDNVMAFWNAPLDNPNHARDACATALEMLKRLEALNAERAAEAEAQGKPFLPLDVGIGINTGECVVGNMGSDVRFDYTVLGDAVNLAARLEGQSKTYGVRTIIGEATARRIGDSFATVELDAIRVKGKQEPETIYAILGPGESPHAQACRDIQQAMAELLACYRDQNWAAALKALRAVRGLETPFDLSALCDLYEARIRAFKRSPPPKNWDGVYTAETK